jgi:hypothetical protein
MENQNVARHAYPLRESITAYLICTTKVTQIEQFRFTGEHFQNFYLLKLHVIDFGKFYEKCMNYFLPSFLYLCQITTEKCHFSKKPTDFHK